MATSIRLAPEIEQRLDFLASQTERTKAFYLRELIERGLGGLWRYRVGDCRVICDIRDDAVRVLVVRIGNRREVYR